MGWTEEETLHSDMNAIEVGYLGRVDMLKAIFGDGKNDKDKPIPKAALDARGKPIVLSPKIFDTMFGRPKRIRTKRKDNQPS